MCPHWRSVSSDLFLIGLFVFLDWSRVSSLYILEIKTLSEESFANIFSHMVGFLFILLMFLLVMQKLFILIKPYLFILSFMSLALGDISVKILLSGISEIFLPIFSSRTFMVLWLTKIHKEVTWLYTRKTNNPIKKWAKDLNRHFSKEDIQRTQRHMKRCSAPLAIREMHIKTSMRYHLTQVRMTIINKSTSADDDVEKREP